MSGLSYETGREMPPGMQAMAALRWIQDLRQILRESIREENGVRTFDMKHVPDTVPLACVLQEFTGTGVVVIDREGIKWKDGIQWIS